MKATFLILLLSGAVIVGNKVADKPVIHPKEDKEFQQLMDEFHQTMSKNKEIQVQADKAKEADIRGNFNSRIDNQEQRINNLEYKDSLKTQALIECKTALSSTTTKLETLDAMGAIKKSVK